MLVEAIENLNILSRAKKLWRSLSESGDKRSSSFRAARKGHVTPDVSLAERTALSMSRTEADRLSRAERPTSQESGLPNGNNNGFLAETLALFHRTKEGHMPPYAYAEPLDEDDPVRGTETFPKYTQRKEYYVYWDERDLLDQDADTIVSYLPHNIHLFELGPGEAYDVKTKKLVDAFKKVNGEDSVEAYTALDVDESFAKHASEFFGGDAVVSDFRSEGLHLEKKSAPVMCIFGGTLFNIPKLKEAKPQHILQTYLEYIRDLVGDDGYVVITQDVNTDEESLMEAYNDPPEDGQELGYCAQTALGIMHRIERDLPTRNFSGHDFEFVARWNEQDQRMTLNARAKRNKSFEISGEGFTMHKGDEWTLVNAFKMSAEVFKACAELSGFEHIAAIKERNNKRQVCHILKAR